MRQEVNLLGADLLPPVERLPLGQVGIVLVGWVVVLAGASAYQEWRLARADAELSVARQQSAAARAEVERLSRRNDAPRERVRLNAQLEQLIGRRQANETLLSALDDETGGGRRGRFSSYFTGVAEAHVPGLWITGLAIDFKADTLRISGAAQNASEVPGFLTQLRGSPAFAGSSVDGIDVRANEEGVVGFEVRGQPG